MPPLVLAILAGIGVYLLTSKKKDPTSSNDPPSHDTPQTPTHVEVSPATGATNTRTQQTAAERLAQQDGQTPMDHGGLETQTGHHVT